MSALYARPLARQVGVTIRGIAYRCGEQGPGTARCEHPVGHDGPIMPPRRHVGRDADGAWQVWETDLTDR